MMINYCLINTKKLLQFKFNLIEDEEDVEKFYADELCVRVFENGAYTFYDFSDYESLDNFLEILDINDIEYDLIDDDGNVIELEDDDGYDYDDDEY